MGGFLDNLGFGVRIVALLFTWLAVAMFVSRELAAVMGLVVVGLWLFFFMPLNYLRELSWQSRQKKIMETALAHSPPPQPYQAGTVLPPPPPHGEVMVVEQAPQGGALDVYRELPNLPALEPRTHSQSFRRSLALPVVGVLMFLGAENDTLMHLLLEARGITQKPPISLDHIVIPPSLREEFADRKMEMEAAARMTLRREPSCALITGGRVEPEAQFVSSAEQAAGMRAGQYVYVFDCLTSRDKGTPFQTWIAPDELEPGKLASLLKTLQAPLPEAQARDTCRKAASARLAPLQSHLVPGPEKVVRYDGASAPYGGYAYLVSQEKLVRADGTGGPVLLSCWVDHEGHARARLLR